MRPVGQVIRLDTPFSFDPQAVVRVDTVRLEPIGRTPQTIWLAVPLQLTDTLHNVEITVTPGPDGRSGPVLLELRAGVQGAPVITSLIQTGDLPPIQPPQFFTLDGSGYGFNGTGLLDVTYCNGTATRVTPFRGRVDLNSCWGGYGDTARSFPIQVRASGVTPALESEIILFTVAIPPGNPRPDLEDIRAPLTYPWVGAGTGDYQIDLLNWAYFVPETLITASKGALSRSFTGVCRDGRGPCSITVPAELLQTPGAVTFVATAPAPGGGPGRPTHLDVLAGNPTPQIARATPASFMRNGPGGTVTLFGSGFNASSTVTDVGSGAPLAVLSFTATQIQATVPAASVAGVLSVRFRVTNPAPAGGSASWEIPVN